MKCSISVLERNESDEGRIKAVWNKLNEEELLVYKRALPGQEKKKTQDELQNYEPQVEDEIPSNFKVVKFTPLQVDEFKYAPPPVIADQRRKFHEYESLAQPFKRDRRFLHVLNVQDWVTTEVNP